jgi:uncharacterized protein YbbC (DUF1343 family)
LVFVFCPALIAASRVESPGLEPDPQLAALLNAVQGKRVGLIANPTSVDRNLRQIADDLSTARGTKVVAFFAPEHGLRADKQAGAQVNDYIDPITGVPGYAVCGTRKAPTDEQLKDIDTVRVYPGTCIFEGTNLSEGRGTTKPFEIIGAPFIEAVELAGALNALNLPGVRFRPCSFVPTFSKFKEQLCGGVQLHVMQAESFEPIRTALITLKTIYAKYPDQVKIEPYASKLMGVPELHERIKTEGVDAIIAGWQENLGAFKALREKYLLYPAESHK